MKGARGGRCRARVVAAALGVALWLSAAGGGQAAPWQVEALRPSVRLGPREAAALPVRVDNLSDGPLRLRPKLEAPPGWREVGAVDPLQLGPGESREVLFFFMPRPGAAAGDYRLRIGFAAEGDGGPGDGEPEATDAAWASFTATVTPEPRLEATVVDSPAFASAGLYDVVFSLRNVGNTMYRLLLRGRDEQNRPADVAPSRVVLAPGETAFVTVRATVPEDVTSSRIHRPELVATDEQSGAVHARAAAQVEIIPRGTAVTDDGAGWPVRLESRVETDGRRVVGSFRLSGRGLFDEGRGEAELVVDVGKRSFISYTTAAAGWTLGRQTFRLSPWTEPGFTGPGLALAARDGQWRLFQYVRDEAVYTGLRAAPAPGAGPFSFAFNLLAPPRPADARWSAEAAWSADGGGRIELEYGGRGGLLRPEERHWAVSVAAAGVGFHTGLSWRRTEPGGKAGGGGEGVQTWRLQHAFRAGGGEAELDWRRSEGGDGRTASLLRGGLTVRAEEDGRRIQVGVGLRLLRDDADGRDEGRLSWHWRYSAPLSRGRWTWGLEGAFTPEGDRGMLRSAVLRWTDDRRFDGQVGLSLPPSPSASALFAAEARYRLDNDHSWYVEATGAVGASEDGVALRVGYTLPVEFSLSPGRRRTAAVAGRVVDGDGAGVPDVILRLGEEAVRTDEDGRYRFPAAPPGEVFLVVEPGRVGADLVVQPAAPRRLVLVPGETMREDFRLERPARLRGVLPLLRIGDEGTDGPPSSGTEARLPEGIVVELFNGEERRRAPVVPGEDAAFLFDKLPPGAWAVSVVGLPEGYRALTPSEPLRLAPGEDRFVVVSVEFRERSVHWLHLPTDDALAVPVPVPSD